MSRSLKQIDPAKNKNQNFQKSKDESSLPIKGVKKDDDGLERFGEELAGFFVDAAPYIGTLAIGEAVFPGLGFAGLLTESAVEIATGAISDATTNTKRELGLMEDGAPPKPNEMIPNPLSVKDTPADVLSVPFGVTAEQGGSSNDPMMLDDLSDVFEVTASQSFATYQPSRDESAPPLRLESEPALNKNEEASTSWIA